MSASITSIVDRRGKPLSPAERLECLLLAKMNEEKAELCTKDQPGIRTFFEMNAKLLHKVAAK